MNTFLIGTNEIRNCNHVLKIAGEPLFTYVSSSDGPIVSFYLLSPPATSEIHISENSARVGDVTLEREVNSFAVYHEGAILLRLAVDEGTIKVDLDLRPVGLSIFTDHKTLHIGGARMSGNVIQNCETAINVGSYSSIQIICDTTAKKYTPQELGPLRHA